MFQTTDERPCDCLQSSSNAGVQPEHTFSISCLNTADHNSSWKALFGSLKAAGMATW